MNKKPYKKVYLEITNICNLSCTFCAQHSRPLEFMSVANFRIATKQLEKLTSHLYFHVMGEPLLHPHFGELVAIAAQSFNINLTTNGLLIDKLSEEIMRNIRKVSISLHCYYANDMSISLAKYLDPIFAFCDKYRDTIIELKLWDEASSSVILSAITEKFGAAQGNTIRPNLYLGMGKQFKWATAPKSRDKREQWNLRLSHVPEVHSVSHKTTHVASLTAFDHGLVARESEWATAPKSRVTCEDSFADIGQEERIVPRAHKFCYGLSDQFAVLVNGTVVPCCQDACGQIPLGNIFEQELTEILSSTRARSIADGFKQNTAVEQLCLGCDFCDTRKSF